MVRAFLALNAVLFLGFGVLTFFNPAGLFIAEGLSLDDISSSLMYELRSNYGGVNIGIGRRDSASPMMGGAAIPVGNDATRCMDKGDWCLNIIGLQARFDDQIDLPRGHQSISIAIHPKARQTRMSRHLGKGGTRPAAGGHGAIVYSKMC